MFSRSSSLLCLLLLSSVVACSEAETPDAQFDGGVPTDRPFDAGPGFGSRDEPCANGRCESSALVCVAEPQPGGGNLNICRERCDLQATDDPCGLGSTCARLLDGDGACLPAGRLDEDCPCDQGFECVALTDTGSGQQVSLCKVACVVELDDGGVLDAGPDAVEDCPGQQSCRQLKNGNVGVCLDD